ncbi:MAG: hypothetical protein AB8F94_13505 [Saprospiraceae bacterium]
MNKMISYLFWMCIPILFIACIHAHYKYGSDFYFPIGGGFIPFEPIYGWLVNAIYFLVIGFVFKKIKIENYFLSFYSFFTILTIFLFYASIIAHEFVPQASKVDHYSATFLTPWTNPAYVISFIWLILQIIFWLKIIIHFFDQSELKLEILDDGDF